MAIYSNLPGMASVGGVGLQKHPLTTSTAHPIHTHRHQTGDADMTANKRTRIAAALTVQGWNRYPSTFAAMMDMASTLPASMTAAAMADVAIRLYQQRAAGKLDTY